MSSLMELAQPGAPQPPRIIIMGEQGVGKTTLAADLGAVIIPCGLEVGYEYITNAKALRPEGKKSCETLQEVLGLLDRLLTEDHPFTAVAIDTLGTLDQLVERYVCSVNGVSGIAAVGGGHGKGYVAIRETWEMMILPRLSKLRENREMLVLLLAHAKLTNATDPELNEYQTWDIAANKGTVAVARAWAEATWFATFKRNYRIENSGKSSEKRKPVQVDAMPRVLFCHPQPGSTTKARLPVPETIPMTKGCAEIIDALKPWYTVPPVGPDTTQPPAA